MQKIDFYPGLHFRVESDKCELTPDGISLIKNTLTSDKDVKAQILQLAEKINHDPADIIIHYLALARDSIDSILENKTLDKELIVGRIEQGIDSKYKDISVGLRIPSPDEIKNGVVEDTELNDLIKQEQENQDRQRLITQNYYHFKPIEHFTIDSKSREVTLTDQGEEYILGQIIGNPIRKYC